jgi:ATP-dependent helicase HrpA
VANEASPGKRAAPPLLFRHDAELPISARRQEIADALRAHQVLIVAGETGSGKSTQLPQYCLELGRGLEGLIAHTQPRRLAARALAARIAEELSQPVGMSVGFRVRFADRVSAATRLVLMTDGLLLAELGSDPQLRRFDTIIVDEAHERSLNVDLLLGVLKRVLPLRPDLKLIITSATLEVERVARFFGGAPVLTVSGRSHPIEVRYAPAPEVAAAGDPAAAAPAAGAPAAGAPEDPDLPAAVLSAYQEIAATPGPVGRGDVLVFLPGEREIRDVAELLERELQSSVEVLPLYSRLSWEQQSKIFTRGARQRIVLATNVAETSVTVPGIRAVIDSGLVRVSRYSPRNRLQRLPIEPVSRASAEQRKGRCGRIGPGLCLRLYSQEDFEARASFTEPEVLRTNLAALLLRLAADGLGEAEHFPFIDPPDARALSDGYRLLQELQALDPERRITRLGRSMARLPLDPRLARALLESKRFHAESELLAIVAALSVPDARIEPVEYATEEAQAPILDDNKSEFTALVKLWRAYRQAREGPRRELRRWCKERGLSLLRLSEWEDVYAQVADRAAEMGLKSQRRSASYTGVHRSLLAGFCTMVGVRGEEGEYLGTRGVRFHIFPGSPLRRRKPRWVMAGNIVETSRVFARRVAEIEPMWVEASAPHLLKREYLEPDWDEAREEVVARERVSFLGLVLSSNRVVNYGPIAPEESRLIFAREALVYQRLQRRPDWVLANDAAIRAGQRLEERLRVRSLLQPPESFVAHYAAILPRQVSSAATLEYFTRHLSAAQRTALVVSDDQIFAHLPDAAALARFPEGAVVNGLLLPVEYRFSPGEAGDGATLRLPELALPAITQAAVDAAIPGLLQPRIEALLRTLPKEVRRALIPITHTAAEAVTSLAAASTNLVRLAQWLRETRGIAAASIRFDAAQVPAHLIARAAVIEDGRVLASGADLADLRRRCAMRARAALDRRAQAAYPSPWRRFEADALPEKTALDLTEGTVEVFPALVRVRERLEVRFEWSAAEAALAFRQGAVYLARTVLAPQERELAKSIAANAPLLLRAAPYLQGTALTDLLLQMTFRRACFDEADPPRTKSAFDAAVEAGRAELHPSLEQVMALVAGWFAEARAVRRLLDDPRARAHAAAAQETSGHLQRLLSAAAIAPLGADWLRQFPRYLKAEERRWQRVLARGSEPPQILRELEEWTARHRALEIQVGAELRRLPELDEMRLWIEEYRVSLYAQELKTLGPVSAPRLQQRAAEIAAWLKR